MASLFENYEQQYSVLTADITAQIGRLRTVDIGMLKLNLHLISGADFWMFSDDRYQLIYDIDKHVEEAHELVCCIISYIMINYVREYLI